METFNKKYSAEKEGRFLKQMKSGGAFVFECRMRHQFVLSKKQVINGKWCRVCAKMVTKLRRKLAKESFQVVSLDGSAEVAAKTRAALAENVEQCRELLEQRMMREQVAGEVRERQFLENRFQRWRKQGAQTQGGQMQGGQMPGMQRTSTQATQTQRTESRPNQVPRPPYRRPPKVP